MRMSTSRGKVQDSIIQCFSPKHEDDMSDEDEGWQGTGAFPRRSPVSGDTSAYIFADEGFDGPYDSLAIVKEDSRETASSSQDGLMAISHSSSETPAISNTAAAVRDALSLQYPSFTLKGQRLSIRKETHEFFARERENGGQNITK
jgi:hypothetical protein